MKLLVTISLILFFSHFSSSAIVYTSPASGSANWSNVSWSTTGSGTPVTYVIQANYTVNLASSVSGIDSLFIFGTLTITVGNNDITMTNNGLVQVFSGGSITGGNPSNHIIIGSIDNRGGYNITGPSYSNSSTTFTTGTASSSAGAALPVTWLNFNVTETAHSNIIEWSTASELNNRHFEVERSSGDGIFHKIGEVNGNGTTQEISNYSFEDVKPLNTSCYYRIKQVDFDGEFDYSRILIAHDKGLNRSISVFPTVISTSNESLKINDVTNNALVKVMDATGKEVDIAGSTFYDLQTNSLRLKNMSSLQSGYYFLYVVDQNQNHIFKIFVQ